MSALAPTELGTVHFIGIGGAGMSVIAEILAADGVRVQGSDARDGAALAGLRERGVRVWIGHDAAHVADAETVVVSSAVRESNPELAAARSAGLRILHRSQALAALMVGRRAVAVAGAHGKTTTSAMVAACLLDAGLDPSYAIGSSVITAEGAGPGGRRGSGDVLVAEADESDGSFLNYVPTVAVVTNIEPDHLDHYGSREAFERAFEDFAAKIPVGGSLVACVDDAGAATLAAAHARRGGAVVTYGTRAESDVRVRDVRPDGSGSAAVFEAAGGSYEVRLAVPGLHNVLNAAAAFAVATLLGVSPEAAARGLAAFLGTGRRFEVRGEAAGVRVVDDYAHHPTEVAALLRAARSVAGRGRVLVVFQPHLYSRTSAFAAEFAAALDAADMVAVTDVYAAREDPDPAVGPHMVTNLMTNGIAVPDRVEAACAIADAAVDGDVILTVGAGDVTEMGDVILDRLRRRG